MFSNLLATRTQMGVSLMFHVIFSVLGVKNACTFWVSTQAQRERFAPLFDLIKYHNLEKCSSSCHESLTVCKARAACEEREQEQTQGQVVPETSLHLDRRRSLDSILSGQTGFFHTSHRARGVSEEQASECLGQRAFAKEKTEVNHRSLPFAARVERWFLEENA